MNTAAHHGERVAVFDPDSRRWRSALIVARSKERFTVVTSKWWAIVPAAAVRFVRIVNAA